MPDRLSPAPSRRPPPPGSAPTKVRPDPIVTTGPSCTFSPSPTSATTPHPEGGPGLHVEHGRVQGGRHAVRHAFGGLTDQAFRMVPMLEQGRNADWPWLT